jgi:hypothetical protein
MHPPPGRRIHHEDDGSRLERTSGLNATTAPQRRRALIQHDPLVSGTTASGSKWGSGLESDDAASTMAGPSPPRQVHHEHDVFVLKTTAPCSKRALSLKMTIPPQPHLATPYHDALAPTTRAPYSKEDTGPESDDVTSTTMGPSATRRSCHKDDGPGLNMRPPTRKQCRRPEDNGLGFKTTASSQRRRRHLKDDNAKLKTAPPPQA